MARATKTAKRLALVRKPPYFTLFFSFKFIFRSRLLCGAVQLNLCGNLDENFVSDQSGGLKEMFQQMDEVEFRQYFRLSREAGHFSVTAARVSRL